MSRAASPFANGVLPCLRNIFTDSDIVTTTPMETIDKTIALNVMRKTPENFQSAPGFPVSCIKYSAKDPDSENGFKTDIKVD
jgi:hypothetical protein